MSSWAICGQRLTHETENSDNDDNDNEDDHTYNEIEDDEENTKYEYVINTNNMYTIRGCRFAG